MVMIIKAVFISKDAYKLIKSEHILNISQVWVMNSWRSPALVGSWKILGKFSQLLCLVIVHPTWLLLNWLGPVSLVNLELHSKDFCLPLKKILLEIMWHKANKCQQDQMCLTRYFLLKSSHLRQTVVAVMRPL